MAKEGIGRIFNMAKNAKTRYLTIPSVVAGDDRFPFIDGEEVKVIIDPDKQEVIIRKLDHD